MCVAMVLALMPAVAFAETDLVAKIGDKEYTSLAVAIEEAKTMPAGTTVTMLEDWTYPQNGKELLNITNSIILDGNGHKITGYGTRSGKNTTLAINNGGSKSVTVTLKNLTIVNNGYEGRPVETRGNINELNIENCKFYANGDGNTQVLTIGGSQSTNAKVNITDSSLEAGNAGYPIIIFNPIEMKIDSSNFDGYCSLYFYRKNSSEGSHGSVVKAKNTTFNAPNEHTTESDSNFGAFVFEDDNISLELDSCKINVEEKNTATQAVVLASSWGNRKSNGFTVTLKGDTSVNGGLLAWIDDKWSSYKDKCYINVESGNYIIRDFKYTWKPKFNVAGGIFNLDASNYAATGYGSYLRDGKYVVAPKATGIKLDKTKATVEVGKTVALKATVVPAETLDTVTWESKNTAVATVKDGVVTAVAPGTTDIYAKVNGKEATCTVSVYKVAEPPKVDNVETTKPAEEVKPIVKQEVVNKATEEAKAVVSDIAEGKTTTAVSENTKTNIKNAINAGKEITTEVVVETVKEEAVKDDAKKADALLADSKVKKDIGDAKIAQYLNLEIVLKADGQELGTINELKEEMTFTIAIPEELKKEGRIFKVVRVHNGVADILDTTMNADGTVTFKTNLFSTYALAYADPATTGTGTATNTKDTPKTGDATNMLPWVALMAVAGAGAVVFKRKED